METLYDASVYPDPVLKTIWGAGNLGVAIANWWMLGWPERVSKLLTQRIYEDEFQRQLSQMEEILARTADMGYFSPVEVVIMSGYSLEPPNL
ncbi:hypothetical protein C8R31_101810 [Nitrosospira sp. Nsp2]|uniref:hypothetical protein n=1 Tax=Nitrosospira sp. Nsp2 TaxID=136548 RepID=UPI000D31E135|nr:hypothetical protein [Nitrosospira sp. Nsp2]PTR17643.1 hypothetical protein C8R31_101810 [Nitrosospira sp. Nsp2]